MKILFVDSWYPEALLFAGKRGETYDEHLRSLLNLHFGTSYYYSDAFRRMGWEAADIIGNDTVGRQMWADEHGHPWASNLDSVVDQIVLEKPDFVYCQDLTFIPRGVMDQLRQRHGIRFVAQHSCSWAGDQQVGGFETVFTSFPHYIHKIRSLGVSAHFLPIAFGHQVLDKLASVPRYHDVVFVGGVNAGRGHWKQGTDVLARVAEDLGARFKWWGYVIGDESQLPQALRTSFFGPAWGLRMYQVYSLAKIVLNRHGEVAEGYANNMRLFEATGMGALLVTEAARNLHWYFESDVECLTYAGPEDAVAQIRRVLDDPDRLSAIAENGQRRTLAEHTYDARLKTVESKLREKIR